MLLGLVPPTLLCTGLENVGRFSANVFTASSQDPEESSSGIFSVADGFPNLAFSWILLNFDPMIGSNGVTIITPDMTHRAPDILPAEKLNEGVSSRN